MISKFIDQNYLHHAYLIEGDNSIILPEFLLFLESLNIKTKANADFYQLEIDSFKMEDAKKLKEITNEKSFSNDKDAKKIFLISANTFLLEAQNSLLKVFEEPIANTHFFIITPSVQVFIPTLLSRFYVIKSEPSFGGQPASSAGRDLAEEAEKFVKLSPLKRIDYIKELLASAKEEDEENPKSTPLVGEDSPRAKALKFLNNLEVVLHKKALKSSSDTKIFGHIFKVRKYLRQSGSSTKSLMESVALGIPEKI